MVSSAERRNLHHLVTEQGGGILSTCCSRNDGGEVDVALSTDELRRNMRISSVVDCLRICVYVIPGTGLHGATGG